MTAVPPARVRRDLGLGGRRRRGDPREAELGVGHRRRAGRSWSARVQLLPGPFDERASAGARRATPSGGCFTTPRGCSRSRGCRPPASRSGRSTSASSIRRRPREDHDPHEAGHHALRERRGRRRSRRRCSASTTWRSIPGTPIRRAWTARRRQMRVLKDGDQIMNVLEPTAMGDIMSRRRHADADPARHPRGRPAG